MRCMRMSCRRVRLRSFLGIEVVFNLWMGALLRIESNRIESEHFVGVGGQ